MHSPINLVIGEERESGRTTNQECLSPHKPMCPLLSPICFLPTSHQTSSWEMNDRLSKRRTFTFPILYINAVNVRSDGILTLHARIGKSNFANFALQNDFPLWNSLNICSATFPVYFTPLPRFVSLRGFRPDSWAQENNVRARNPAKSAINLHPYTITETTRRDKRKISLHQFSSYEVYFSLKLDSLWVPREFKGFFRSGKETRENRIK